MKLYQLEQDKYKIYNGSMLDLLEVIEPNSIDSIVTDPPYHLQSIVKRFGKENSKEAQHGSDGSFKGLSKGFMGKEWDGGDIAFDPETWKKCYTALKSGGYLLAFGGSRTFHRIAVAIEDAGFEIRDTIMWLYGSGFPKSYNISKGIESKIKYNKSNTVALKRIEQDGDGKKYQLKGRNNGIMGEERLYERKEYSPTNDIAKQWQGWGTALKPAYEPVIVARKPIEKTVAENVIKYGVGGINIDECKIGNEERTQFSGKGTNGSVYYDYPQENAHMETVNGRFPANVIHDGSEDVVNGFPDTKSTLETPNNNHTSKGNKEVFKYGYKMRHGSGFDDSGSASRYFYTAKTSKKDRDDGLDTGLSTVNDGRKKTIDNPYQRGETPRKNTHPTVKPTELMQYLIRLVSPKGATILDPFMGSGSTGKATMFENRERNANYKFIGIDLEEEYCSIAANRIDYALNKYEYDYEKEMEEAEERGQLSLDL